MTYQFALICSIQYFHTHTEFSDDKCTVFFIWAFLLLLLILKDGL